MILVPGVPLINGVRDLVQGHAGIGVARLANGLIVVLAIATGLAIVSMFWRIELPVALQTPNLPVSWDLAFRDLLPLALRYSLALRGGPSPRSWCAERWGMGLVRG
jgi:hypothetical protein